MTTDADTLKHNYIKIQLL